MKIKIVLMLSLSLIGLAVLAACGQSGALYLPAPSKTQSKNTS